MMAPAGGEGEREREREWGPSEWGGESFLDLLDLR
jgi:hypothetical protein